jgi:hypothetical protein
MKHPFEYLPVLAEMERQGHPEAPRIRHDVEEGLELLICSAIRSGAGKAEVVNWVRANLPDIPEGAAPETAAPSLAHLLCDTILNRNQPCRAKCQATRETVRAW